MNTERFDYNYIGVLASIEMDTETGDIVAVYHRGTDAKIYIPDVFLERLKEDTQEIRDRIIDEVDKEAKEYADHLDFETKKLKS